MKNVKLFPLQKMSNDAILYNHVQNLNIYLAKGGSNFTTQWDLYKAGKYSLIQWNLINFEAAFGRDVIDAFIVKYGYKKVAG